MKKYVYILIICNDKMIYMVVRCIFIIVFFLGFFDKFVVFLVVGNFWEVVILDGWKVNWKFWIKSKIVYVYIVNYFVKFNYWVVIVIFLYVNY